MSMLEVSFVDGLQERSPGELFTSSDFCSSVTSCRSPRWVTAHLNKPLYVPPAPHHPAKARLCWGTIPAGGEDGKGGQFWYLSEAHRLAASPGWQACARLDFSLPN